MHDIRGSIAVITGAGSGIGRALAQELVSRGASLALADINSTGLDETRKLLGTAACKTYVVDVSDPADVEGFAQQVTRDFGRASLLLNNAGVALRGTFAEVSLADMEWLLGINFWGVVYGCKFFLPLLQREAEAHIVNISSAFGLMGIPGQAAYCSSKFAVRGFTEVLRHELSATNIKVTCVHPGAIRTPIAVNARAGAGAQPIGAEIVKMFEELAQTTPETAAGAIVKGILKNQPRVLIGPDASQIDILQRLMPVRGPTLVVSRLQKQALSMNVPNAAAVTH